MRPWAMECGEFLFLLLTWCLPGSVQPPKPPGEAEQNDRGSNGDSPSTPSRRPKVSENSKLEPLGQDTRGRLRRGRTGMTRLTKRVVDATAPGPSDVFIWDGEVKGFGLRVKPSSVRSYACAIPKRGRPIATSHPWETRCAHAGRGASACETSACKGCRGG